MEVGIRSWLFYVSNRGEDHTEIKSNNIASEKPKEKRLVDPLNGKVTLGNLVVESVNPGRVYEFIPDIYTTYLGKPFETNSFGMRERDISKNKPDNIKRIVGIGDSVMFGWGVSVNDSYLRVLESDLNENYKNFKVETLNFAVPGYNTAMEVSTYLGLAQDFAPDLVIMHFVENDLTIPHFMVAPENYLSLQKSFLIHELKKLYQAIFSKDKGDSNEFVGMDFSGVEKVEEDLIKEKYKYMVGREGFFMAMDKLKSSVCHNRVPVVILVGRLRPPFKEILETAASQYGFHLVEAIPYVNSYIKENNLKNTPQARKKLLWISDNDPHPNELGHRLYANALSPIVQEILEEKSDQYLPKCEH